MKTVGSPDLRIRVLVVDDELVSRLTLCQLLQLSGYFCAMTTNGAQALELVPSFRPQAIIMDLMMPVLDGFETTRQLKENEETRHIPIVALTASTTPEDHQEATDAGVDAFLTKPINLDQLLLHLRKQVREEDKSLPVAKGATRSGLSTERTARS
jgi:CheY-like chemotaxis protein